MLDLINPIHVTFSLIYFYAIRTIRSALSEQCDQHYLLMVANRKKLDVCEPFWTRDEGAPHSSALNPSVSCEL